jgi:gas vesicle protein
MFGFKKKKEKKVGHLDKILMGVVVGGAIGSVLGVSLAPKKGSETRKDISKYTNQAIKTTRRSAFDLFKKVLKGKKGQNAHQPEISVKNSSVHHSGKPLPEDK